MVDKLENARKYNPLSQHQCHIKITSAEWSMKKFSFFFAFLVDSVGFV